MKAPSVENRFQLHPAIKHSTFNTICEIKMPASSLLLFATGAELSALSFVTSAELESGSFATGSPQYEAVSTTRCLPLLSAVINLQPVGKSMWASESYVLVLTHRYMYHIRVQCTGSSEHRSDDIELVQTLKIPMHPDVYSMTSIPHSHISCAALMASGPSIDSNDVLYLWDHVAGLRLHSKGSGRYTSAAEGSGAQIPLPAVQYSHHPQVLNQSWLRRLQRVDLRTAAPHLMYETSDSYIINSSVSPRSTLHATDHSFGGTDDHHVLLSQSSRQILLIDVRHSARPLATRPAPAFSHCHMRSYAAADFCCDESVSNSSGEFICLLCLILSLLFVLTRCSPILGVV